MENLVLICGELIGIDCLLYQTWNSVKENGAEKDEGEDYVAEEEKEQKTVD